MTSIPLPELISAFLDGEVTAEERAVVEQALVEDAGLRRLYYDLRAIRDRLTKLPKYRIKSDLSRAVLRQAERILQRERRNAEQAVPPGTRNGWWKIGAWAGALAASVAVMALLSGREDKVTVAMGEKADAPVAKARHDTVTFAQPGAAARQSTAMPAAAKSAEVATPSAPMASPQSSIAPDKTAQAGITMEKDRRDGLSGTNDFDRFDEGKDLKQNIEGARRESGEAEFKKFQRDVAGKQEAGKEIEKSRIAAPESASAGVAIVRCDVNADAGYESLFRQSLAKNHIVWEEAQQDQEADVAKLGAAKLDAVKPDAAKSLGRDAQSLLPGELGSLPGGPGTFDDNGTGPTTGIAKAKSLPGGVARAEPLPGGGGKGGGVARAEALPGGGTRARQQRATLETVDDYAARSSKSEVDTIYVVASPDQVDALMRDMNSRQDVFLNARVLPPIAVQTESNAPTEIAKEGAVSENGKPVVGQRYAPMQRGGGFEGGGFGGGGKFGIAPTDSVADDRVAKDGPAKDAPLAENQPRNRSDVAGSLPGGPEPRQADGKSRTLADDPARLSDQLKAGQPAAQPGESAGGPVTAEAKPAAPKPATPNAATRKPVGEGEPRTNQAARAPQPEVKSAAELPAGKRPAAGPVHAAEAPAEVAANKGKLELSEKTSESADKKMAESRVGDKRFDKGDAFGQKPAATELPEQNKKEEDDKEKAGYEQPAGHGLAVGGAPANAQPPVRVLFVFRAVKGVASTPATNHPAADLAPSKQEATKQ